MSGYYPAGVDSSHPHFNPPDPPTCSEHGEEMYWDEEAEDWRCPCADAEGDCYHLDAEDIAYLKAEQSAEWQERHGGGL